MKLSMLPLLAALLLCSTAQAQDFGPAATISTGPKVPFDIVATDLDGDGDLDLVGVGDDHHPGKIYWYEQVQDGLFNQPAIIWDGGDWPDVIRVGDLDGDGDDDFVVENSFNYYHVIEQRGPGTPGQWTSLGWAFHDNSGMELVDMDGDGDLDVLVGLETSQDALFWFDNLGAGIFSDRTKLPQAITHVYDLDGKDFDGDGILDVLVSHSVGRAAPLSWFRGLGGGTFAPLATLFQGDMVWEFDVVDLDADGDLDLLYRTTSPHGMGILRNDGAGVLTPVGTIPSLPNQDLHEVQVGDFDGDTLPDALLVMESPLTFAWCKNLGSLQFAPKSVLPGAPKLPTTSPLAVLVEDLDGDGDQDLVYNAPGQPALAWQDSFPQPKDCNGNGVPDSLDISSGTSIDCNGNLVPDECDALHTPLDIDGDLALDACLTPPLYADTFELSVSAGGVQTFQVQSPVTGAFQLFILMGSTSGVSPGIPIDGHTLPLNLDAYLLFTLQSPSSLPLSSSLGVLLSSGAPAHAPAFTLPPASDASLIGMTIHHAYAQYQHALLGGNVVYTSNPVPLTFLP